MNTFAQTIIALSGVLISELINKGQPMFIRYLCHFLVILGLLSASKAYCLTPEASHEMFFELAVKAKTKAEYIAKRDAHYVQALKCKAALRELCWWLPKMSDRETAKWCLTTFVATIPANTPQSKAMAMILAAMAQYGLCACDQWQEIKSLEHQTQYHYEMFEFYADLVNNWKG